MTPNELILILQKLPDNQKDLPLTAEENGDPWSNQPVNRVFVRPQKTVVLLTERNIED